MTIFLLLLQIPITPTSKPNIATSRGQLQHQLCAPTSTDIKISPFGSHKNLSTTNIEYHTPAMLWIRTTFQWQGDFKPDESVVMIDHPRDIRCDLRTKGRFWISSISKYVESTIRSRILCEYEGQLVEKVKFTRFLIYQLVKFSALRRY